MAGAIGSLLGFSGGLGVNSGTATSVATTAGSKEVVAQVVQNVQQRTQQHATASRGRRAASIVETSQSEHDVASTRVLTNYNHMHALTIQYYEVLQVYRTSTRALETQPVLFIPVRLITFTDTLIETHKDTLQAAAAALESHSRARRPGDTWPARIGAFQPKQIFALVAPMPGREWNNYAHPDAPFTDWPAVFEQAAADLIDKQPDLSGAKLTAIQVTPEQGRTLKAVVIGTQVHAFGELKDGTITLNPGADCRTADDLVRAGAPLGVTIGLRYPDDVTTWGSTTVTYSVVLANGRAVKLRHMISAPDSKVRKVNENYIAAQSRMVPPIAALAVRDHLNRHAVYYTVAIWKSQGLSLGAALGAYKIAGKRVLDIIDPHPVACTANLIGFRLTDPALAAKMFVESNPRPLETEVTLPTGGVFAEAVLGRSNAAEKLDLTRFWNWQDSPIPILPPEIAPVSLGSRAQSMDLTTSGLESQAASLQSLQQLPDPKGMESIVHALTSRIFLDMSNARENAETLRAALKSSGEGAKEATSSAVETYKAALEHQREMARTAVDAAKTLLPLVAPEAGAASAATRLTGGGNGAALAGSLSKVGGVLNTAEKLDAKSGGSGNVQAAMESLTGRAARTNGDDWLIPEPDVDEIVRIRPSGA
jgi:hypothetical protein